jgi:hypothetical protein
VLSRSFTPAFFPMQVSCHFHCHMPTHNVADGSWRSNHNSPLRDVKTAGVFPHGKDYVHQLGAEKQDNVAVTPQATSTSKADICKESQRKGSLNMTTDALKMHGLRVVLSSPPPALHDGFLFHTKVIAITSCHYICSVSSRFRAIAACAGILRVALVAYAGKSGQ